MNEEHGRLRKTIGCSKLLGSVAFLEFLLLTGTFAGSPTVETIATGRVMRISDRTDRSGGYVAPWKEVRIENIFGFKKKPVRGEKVTVIPLDVGIDPLELRIMKVTPREGCTGKPDVWYQIDLEVVLERKFYEVSPLAGRHPETPFNVCVLYPAVPSARNVPRTQLQTKMLPENVSADVLIAGVDLTGDETPEVVITEHCCGNPSQASSDGKCEYVCGETYRRSADGWRLVDRSQPC